jgi:hypothetical protein
MKRAPADLMPEEEALFRRLSGAHRSCPDPAQIQAAAAGVLPEPADALREHLATCAACAALAADLAAWEGPELSAHEEERIWQEVRRGTRVRAPRPATRGWIWAAAAAVFAAAVPAYVLVRPVAPSPTPSAGAGVATAPGFALPVDKLSLRTPPGAALVWRGGESSYERDLQQALASYDAGDLDQAARRLEALSGEQAAGAAAPLYRGVALLLLGRPGEAVPVLRVARERATPFWRPHAQWYLAVASERAGESEGAAALLRELCGGGSEYDARACAGARALSGAGR